MTNLLPFISDENLVEETKKVINIFNLALKNAPNKIYNNAIDPFSATFQAVSQGMSSSKWLELETNRQTQKTLQNAIGIFHQNIIGSIEGWESLPTGNVIDLRNLKMKIIAELKNKYNTTKGNHRVDVYDDLEGQLSKKEYRGFTGYLIEIIPKGKKRYNVPFTPPDNRTHTQRKTRKDLRVISGQVFYDFATNHKGSLRMLYNVLPDLITDITGKKIEKEEKDFFQRLFLKSY
jgi:hypothetical protein